MSERYTYRFYFLEEILPVKVEYNDRGFKVAALAPDQSTGTLSIKNTLLSRLETSHDVEEIDEERFDALVRQILGHEAR